MTKGTKIERLDQLTMGQFLDIACGDYRLLGGDMKRAAEIIGDFRRISNPADYEAALSRGVQQAMRRAKILLYSVLLALLSMDGEAEVKKILGELGRTRTTPMDAERLRRFLEQQELSERAAYERERNEDDEKPVDAKQLRADFYTEVSVLMRHFKMAIELQSINAEVYANLRHQADEDAKAMRAAMAK